MIKRVFDDFFRFIGVFSTVLIIIAFVKGGIAGSAPEFPLSGELLPWLVVFGASLAGAFVRQRKTQ